MTELLPCPFCGGKAERIYKSGNTHIECTQCRAQFPKSTMENRYVEAWNARAERTCTVVSSLFDGTMGERCIELSCGHCVWDRTEPPSYCPLCGAKVVDE